MQFIGFIPLRKMIQVERLQESDLTSSGLTVPDIAQQKSEVCKVLAVGPDVADIEVGDYVQVRRYAGSDQKIFGKDTVVLDYEEVMGKYVTVEQPELAIA